MEKILSKILIVVGIVIYTIILLTFLEIPANYRTVLLFGEYLMCVGISMAISEKRK